MYVYEYLMISIILQWYGNDIIILFLRIYALQQFGQFLNVLGKLRQNGHFHQILKCFPGSYILSEFNIILYFAFSEEITSFLHPKKCF